MRTIAIAGFQVGFGVDRIRMDGERRWWIPDDRLDGLSRKPRKKQTEIRHARGHMNFE